MFGSIEVAPQGQPYTMGWRRLANSFEARLKEEIPPDQGERRSTQHAPDTERGARVTRVGRRAESSTGKQGNEVHCLAPPSDRRSAAGKLLLTKEESRTRSGRGHLAGI